MVIEEKICMNEECKDNIYLSKSPTNKPIIRLGKVCWNCKSSEFLV